MAAVRLDVGGFRTSPFRMILAVEGYNLTGRSIRFAVKLKRDAPGDPLIELISTTSAGADGCRFVTVLIDDDGVPTSLIEIIASAGLMEALPPAAEVGADLVLAWDLKWSPPDDGSGFSVLEETVLWGDFIVKGSVND